MAPKRPQKKHPGGRPTRYHAEWIPKYAASLVRQGLTYAQIAKELGIARSTFNKWLTEKPEFSEALEKAQEAPNDQVRRALFERAIGFEHPEEKIQYDQQRGEFVRTMTTKKYPPETAAAKFWLINKAPDEFAERQEVEHSGPDGGPIVQIMIPDNGRGPNADGDS